MKRLCRWLWWLLIGDGIEKLMLVPPSRRRTVLKPPWRRR